MPEQYDGASELDESEEVLLIPLVSDDQSTEVLQPGEEAFDLPASLVPSEHPAVLCFWFRRVASVRRDHHRAELSHYEPVQRIAVVGSVADQSDRCFFDEAGIEDVFNERDLMRASTGDAQGDRKARAVCNCHDLGPFPALCLTHGIAPFLAGANVPTMKHSETSIPPPALRSSASAHSTCSRVPDVAQLWNRLWHVG